MISDFNCPACQSQAWIQVERFRLLEDDHIRVPKKRVGRWKRIQGVFRIIFRPRPRRKVIQCSNLDEYQRIQREIIFGLWLPSRKVIDLVSQYCGRCGLMVFKPRPTTEEIAEKYRYMEEQLHEFKGRMVNSSRSQKMDHARSNRIFDKVIFYKAGKKMRVLDYGGGDGRMLQPFLEKGHETFLADFSKNQIQGVTKLADDISGLSTEKKFDVIMCNHVLEHVAEPARLLSDLYKLMTSDGIVFAEVPQEILAGVNLAENPAMHVNFFTKNSLRTLFEKQGFFVHEVKQKVSHYASYFQEVIWLIATPAEEQKLSSIGKNDIMKRLRPSRFFITKRQLHLFLLSRIFNFFLRE